MIHIAICLSDQAESAFISSEMQTCFHSRNILVSVKTFSYSNYSLSVLMRYKPDIFIYSLSDRTLKLVSELKKNHAKMISIITENASADTACDFHLLQPVYELSQINRKNLWECARKAYEFYLNDNTTFYYYRRPQYISTSINDILYFVSEARRVHLYSIDRSQQTFYYKLDDIEHCLTYKKCKFVRIHKSYLVNTKYITDIDREKIHLSTGEALKISSYERYVQLMHELHSCKIS